MILSFPIIFPGNIFLLCYDILYEESKDWNYTVRFVLRKPIPNINTPIKVPLDKPDIIMANVRISGNWSTTNINPKLVIPKITTVIL